MKTKYWYWIWRTFLGPSRLRRKFVKTFLLSGLIPLILMGGVSIYLVNLTHRADVADLEHTLARQVANEIRSIIQNIRAELSISYTFENFAPILFADQHAALEDFLRSNASIREVSFICTTPAFCTVGRETARLLKTEEDVFAEGALRLLADSPEFIEAKAGTSYISPLDFSEQQWVLSIAVPVRNQRDQIIAVLLGRMNLAAVQDIVAGTALGETGYVYVVDGTGRIIAHPDESRIGTTASALPPAQPFVVAEGAPPKRFAESSVYESMSGTLVSGVTSSIPELNWRVVAEWPQAETQVVIWTITLQVAGFALLAFIILVSIASWMALRLIQPIAKLRQGTSIIGGGNFGYRVNIQTGDELEDLGKNLNKMAENLKGLDEIKELRLRTDLLSESLKKEQELSKLKDQFITTVSHQFNTPLSVINWTLESLNEPRPTKAKIKEGSEVIAKSAKDIANIVSDLVTLSDIGFRYQKSKAKSTDLSALVQKSIDRFAAEAKIKKVQLSYRAPAEPAILEANEFTLAKAIDNLIDNALSYTNEGGSVTAELSKKDGGLLFSVTDTGIGIPAEDQASIFQQFFRSKTAVKTKNVGTGLGLFIVKTIIEGHGGKIWFESAEGKGSTFFVSLPPASEGSAPSPTPAS